MKKLFVAVLAIAAAVACNTAEIVDLPQNPQINFANAFVQNATRADVAADPSTKTADLASFNVWGFMDEPAGQVFVEELVTKSGDAWGYTNTQYWVAGHTYYFAALAPMDSNNWSLDTANANEYGAGVLTFTNVDGTEDLLYTAASVTTPDMATLTAAGMPSVSLTFNHLLSKVKFTFGNGFTTPNYTLEVKNIEMTAPKNGTIDLAVANWWDNDDWKLGADATVLSFGDVAELEIGKKDVCTNQRLTIPAGKSQSYTVTFDVVLYVSGVEAMTVQKTATLSNVAFDMGKCYNISTEITPENLGLHEIVFDVDVVNGWIHGGDYDAIVAM